MQAYNEEIDLLQDEQEILNSENAKLLEETEQLKSKINELEKAVYSKQQVTRANFLYFYMLLTSDRICMK